MRITINGALDSNATKLTLSKQLEKIKVIDDFCKVNKIKELIYKDSELEYNYISIVKKNGGAKDE